MPVFTVHAPRSVAGTTDNPDQFVFVISDAAAFVFRAVAAEVIPDPATMYPGRDELFRIGSDAALKARAYAEQSPVVVISGSRWVIHSGARIEFPLTSGQTGELALQ